MDTLDEFINGRNPEELDFTIVDGENPVEWFKLFSSVVGSVVVGTTGALLEIPAAVVEGANNLLSGGEDAISTLVDGLFAPFTGIVAGIYDIALIDSLGLLAGPVAVAIVLAAMYAFARGMQLVVDAAQGGGRL